MKMTDDEFKKLNNFIGDESRKVCRNWNYNEREELQKELEHEVWIKVLENGDWTPSGILNEDNKVQEEIEIKIRGEFSNQKSRYINGRLKTPLTKTSKDVEGYLNASDLSINAGIPIEVTDNTNAERPYKASWERSQRYPDYIETHSYIEDEELLFLDGKHREIVGAIINDPYKKDRPKGELSQRDGIIQELKITKEDYQNTKKKVVENYDILYKPSPAKPLYSSASEEIDISIFFCTPILIKKTESEAKSNSISNGESNEDSDARKQKEIEIKQSNILSYFIELEDVKCFLHWVKLVNGDSPFTVWHKRKNHPYVDKKEGTHKYYSPQGCEALFIEQRAGCCGNSRVQHLCYECGVFTWFCWSCGEKVNTKICYKDYPNTLSGFLLSLYEQRKGTVGILIRHAKEWNSLSRVD
jgi:hypothetical protein